MNEPPCPRPIVLASGIVLLGALSTASLWGRSAGPLLWLDVAVVVLSLLTTVVQVWWPVAGTVAATALALLSPTASPAAISGALQVAQRRRFTVAAAVAAGGLGVHVAQALWRANPGIALGWWLVLVVAAYGAMLGWGTQARSRRALLTSLHDRAVRAEAEQGRRVAEARMAERRTLAREMHDVLAHRLTLVATHAGALEYRPDASPEQLAKAAGVVRAGVRQALEELRQVIGLLHEDEHDDLAPLPTLADLPRLLAEARQAGQPVDLHDKRDGAALPPPADRTAYRVVQEGLTNARKHAPGRAAQIVLHGAPGSRLQIEVSNPLLPDASPDTSGSGLGLVGLTERVRLAGGQLDHQAIGGRFVLRAWLPWPA